MTPREVVDMQSQQLKVKASRTKSISLQNIYNTGKDRPKSPISSKLPFKTHYMTLKNASLERIRLASIFYFWIPLINKNTTNVMEMYGPLDCYVPFTNAETRPKW